MKLIWADDFLIPAEESDEAMFAHCTNNSRSITFGYYQDCEPVFHAHGIEPYVEPRTQP